MPGAASALREHGIFQTSCSRVTTTVAGPSSVRFEADLRQLQSSRQLPTSREIVSREFSINGAF
jgi:hypothetical protein